VGEGFVKEFAQPELVVRPGTLEIELKRTREEPLTTALLEGSPVTGVDVQDLMRRVNYKWE